MQIFIAALIGALIQFAGSLVGRVLLSLGIGYASYSGIDTSIGWVRDYVVSQLNGAHSVTLQVMSVLRIGSCISILRSALLARMTLNGMTSGTLKRFTVKG